MSRRRGDEIGIIERVIADMHGVSVREFMRDDDVGQYLDLGSRPFRLAVLAARIEQIESAEGAEQEQ